MKKIYTIALVLATSFGLAQNKNLKKANQWFEGMHYSEAAATYNTYLDEVSEPTAELVQNAADANFYVNDAKNALKWYEKLYKLRGEHLSDLYFLRYQQSLRGVKNYEKAEEVTKEYLRMKDDVKRIDAYTQQKKYVDSLATTTSLYTINQVGVNSSKSDFGVAFYGDKVVFASAKDSLQVDSKLYSWNQQPFLSMFIADRNAEDGNLFNDKIVFPEIRSSYHDGTVTFSKDGKIVYFTTNIVSKKNKQIKSNKGFNNLQILKGTIENNRVVKTEKVSINSVDYSVGHPALSPDGKWLFFVSDMPGGYGETDIYVARITEDGDVTDAKNLGATINTEGRDMFPFFVNNTLYFASEGHFGLGGLDIFSAAKTGDWTFESPKNLGAPVNSNKDDFSFIIDDKIAYGYFSSNRDGGTGDDDIYSFKKAPDVCLETISGKVTNVKNGVPIITCTVKAFDEFDDYIGAVETDINGHYSIEVPCGSKVRVEASKEEHSTESRIVPLSGKHTNTIPNINFELVKYEDLIVVEDEQEKIDINPIFFEFDKSDITEQAAIELDRVVYAMTKFPNIKIKIESHTDSRGRDAYNLKLSDDRAKSTQQYIISNGIDAARVLSAIGYGETRLKNRCKNGVKCSEEEHFVNRRSDFIVIEK